MPEKDTVDYVGDLDSCIESYFKKYIEQKCDGDPVVAMRRTFERALILVAFFAEHVDPNELIAYVKTQLEDGKGGEDIDTMLSNIEVIRSSCSWFMNMQEAVMRHSCTKLNKTRDELQRMAEIAGTLV